MTWQLGIVAKSLDRRVSRRRLGICRDTRPARTARAAAAIVERLHPLAEHDRLSAAGRAFFQVGFQPLQLAARAGGRIEVADLLQPQHQLEHVADRQLVLHFPQPNHALVLRQSIRLGLLRRELHFRIAKQLGRQVGEHLVLRAAQDVVRDRPANRPRFHLRIDLSRRDELKNADQILDAVFDRRAGKRPTAAAANRPHDFVGRAGHVFDALRFIEHDQVVMIRSDRRHRPDRARPFRNWRSSPHSPPSRHMPLPPGRAALDGRNGQLRRPLANSRCQLVTSGLGQTSSTRRN